MPHWHGAEIHYSGTPELMELYAGPGGRLRRADHRRLLRHQAGPCRGDAARASTPIGAGPRPTVGDNRRRARPAGRARGGGDRPRAAGGANGRERQGQAARLGRREPEPTRGRQRLGRAPLVAPSGPQIFEVGAAGAGERLDRYLGQAAAERRIALSRTRLKALIEAGEVTVDGEVVRDPAMRLAEGARIAFEPPPPEESPLVGEDLPLDVVYEDEHLIVIDKPAGLVVHPAPGHAQGTLVNALIRHCGASLSGIGGVRRPGIVHRLDKDTSGLLVVAKTDAAHRGLADLFADHGRTGSLEREYLALVWGGFDAAAGKVDAAIARHPRHREKMAVVARGARPARRHPLAARRGAGAGEPRRLPARDRADPSDPRPHGLDRPSASRRFGLWRRLQNQGVAAFRGSKGRRLRRWAVKRCTRRRSASSIRSPARRCASRARRRRIFRGSSTLCGPERDGDGVARRPESDPGPSKPSYRLRRAALFRPRFSGPR